MKFLEYYYNIIYYFFYRGFVRTAIFIGTHNPFILLIYFYYKIPSVKQKWLDKGIENPYRHHIDIRIKKFIINTEFGLGTMYAGGLSITVVFFTYIGLFHIFRNFFLPNMIHSISFPSLAITMGIAAFLTDLFLSENNFIKQFDKKKGWWRTKWATITALSPFIAIWFAISTSSIGAIGQYILNLRGYQPPPEPPVKTRIIETNDGRRISVPDIEGVIWTDEKIEKK